MGSKGVGGHQRPYRGHSSEWLTPPEILAALGPFDLDPCSPADRPWDTARIHYTAEMDGLTAEWPKHQRIWLNQPYGPETGKWLQRLAEHGTGTALVFARTETEMFHRWGWECATGMLFLKGRLHFYNVKGERANFNSGAPSVLIAYGIQDAERIGKCGLAGKYVWLGEAW